MNISDKLQEIKEKAQRFVVRDAAEMELFRLEFLVKKSELNTLFDEFKKISDPNEKREIGKQLNLTKNLLEEQLKEYQIKFATKSTNKTSHEDYTLPGYSVNTGSRHPLQIVSNQIIEILSTLGFSTSEGPEIEDDWHNFSALNFAENHPARDMQDTFFIDSKNQIALRTHTSSVQVRVMENQKPPIRSLMLGRVYRNEAISARANCFFHQMEGLYIDEKVSFADLKQTLYYFVKQMFGEDVQIRFRPSYFPFTEPSAEMDITCFICGGSGCNVCKQSGWVEIMGCGMVHPNVLINCKIDSEKYTGFAFGMGIERITMLKFGVKDLRTFFENDLRFLKQFS